MKTPRPLDARPLATRASLTALALGLALALTAVALPAWAQDVPPIEFYTNGPLLVDSDAPTLTLTCADRLTNVEVELRRGRETVRERFATIYRGNPAEITFDAPLGNSEWDVTVRGEWDPGSFELGFSFAFDVTEGLEVNVLLDQVDLDARRLALTLSSPADRVEYSVMADTGDIIGSGSVPFDGAAPGTPLVVEWSQREGNVMKISLTAHDTLGFWSEVEIIPWSVDIPHEEIHFPSGSDAIPEDELHKVDDAYQQLVAAVERYGRFVDINLYVAGYTDTVGSGPDNQRLSEARARSIARAFRDRGFHFPVFYQGFGEDALAVATADGVDQVANRRALYILAAQPPLPSHHVPRDAWRRLE